MYLHTSNNGIYANNPTMREPRLKAFDKSTTYYQWKLLLLLCLLFTTSWWCASWVSCCDVDVHGSHDCRVREHIMFFWFFSQIVFGCLFLSCADGAGSSGGARSVFHGWYGCCAFWPLLWYTMTVGLGEKRTEVIFFSLLWGSDVWLIGVVSVVLVVSVVSVVFFFINGSALISIDSESNTDNNKG